VTTSLAHVRQHTVPLADGRSLRAFEAGDPHGPLVVHHHGTPGSGLLLRQWAKAATELGIRLVGYDRAGYGGSDRKPGRCVADIGADMAQLADHLGAGRFYTWGMSGGGPHALGTAGTLGDRVIAVAAIAAVAPYDADGLVFDAGMGQDNIDEFAAAVAGEAALAPYLGEQAKAIAGASAEQLRDAMRSLLPEVDRAALTGQTAEFMHANVAHGLQGGLNGWLDDDRAFVTPWGFDVGSIRVPTLLLQGDQDLMVPFAHGRWLAAAMPRATARLLPGEGHISLLARVSEVHDWLLTHPA